MAPNDDQPSAAQAELDSLLDAIREEINKGLENVRRRYVDRFGQDQGEVG